MLTQPAEAPAAPLLDDVSVWVLFDRGSPEANTYIVGSVTSDRYVRVPGTKLRAVRAFMHCLDGRRTVGEIELTLLRDHNLRLDANALYRRFQGAGLLADGSGPAPGDIECMSATLLRLPIGGLLRALRRAAGWAVPLVCAALALIAAAAALYLLHPGAAGPPRATSLVTVTGLAVVVTPLSVVLHELSHCFAAACWGIRRGTLRAHLYLGILPMFALKFAGLYTLPPRGRVVVWSAGVFANLSAAAASLVALATVRPHSPALEMAVTINWLMFLVNLVPLLPTDGYFILTTLTRNPNVRVQAWALLRHPLRARRERLPWPVPAYVVSTIAILAATLWYHLARLVEGAAPWQSLVSLLFLMLFPVMLWRSMRRQEDYL